MPVCTCLIPKHTLGQASQLASHEDRLGQSSSFCQAQHSADSLTISHFIQKINFFVVRPPFPLVGSFQLKILQFPVPFLYFFTPLTPCHSSSPHHSRRHAHPSIHPIPSPPTPTWSHATTPHPEKMYNKEKKIKIYFNIFIQQFTSTKQTQLLGVSIKNHE